MTRGIDAPVRRRCGEIDDLIRGILAAGGTPLSAYDISARASAGGRRIAPAQVYRTLDRLVRRHWALRIEMLGAYVMRPESADLCLVCLGCRGVEFVEDAALRTIHADAAGRHFRLATAPVEARGLCGTCADTDWASQDGIITPVEACGA